MTGISARSPRTIRPIARRLVFGLGGCIVVILGVHQLVAQRRTPVTITRLYTGADGQTHAARIEVKLMPSATFPGLEESEAVKVTRAQYLSYPPGFVQDWHNASHRQYVVVISGRGEVELVGGQKVPLALGGVVLAEDVSGRGHITRSLGRENLILLLVPFAEQ